MIEAVLAFGLMLVCLVGWFATHVRLQRAYRALHVSNDQWCQAVDTIDQAAIDNMGLRCRLEYAQARVARMTTRTRGVNGRFCA